MADGANGLECLPMNNGKGQVAVGRLGKPLRAGAIRVCVSLPCVASRLHCCSGQNDMGSVSGRGEALMQVPEMQSTASCRGQRK